MKPKDALDTLGTLIGEDEGRDAVHIAVVPAIADEVLYPGQHVSWQAGHASTKGKLVGIVDAFLACKAMTGDRFWLMLYPRTITGLRHVWTHPDIPADTPTGNKSESELWLRQFVATADCPDYDTLIAAATGRSVVVDGEDGDYYHVHNDGEYLHFGGRDAHGEIPTEFWDHVEVVTGVKIPKENRAGHFSCSC